MDRLGTLMGKVAKSKSPDTSRNRLVEQFLYYDHQAYERLTQADQEDLLREGTPVYLEPAD